MSLLVTSVLVATGVLVGRWIARGGRTEPRDGAAEAHAEGDAKEPAPPRAAPQSARPAPPAPKAPATRAPARDPFAALPCKLGDVVMRSSGDEAWLAGASIFLEDEPVAALFVAPEAGRDRAVYARARPSGALDWLEPIAPGELTVGAEPPTSLEHAGVRYERARRLPVKVERAGSGAPDLGESVILAEYTSPGFARLLVVTGSGASRAWVGVALDEGTYEVIPSGRSTLEE